MERETKIVLKLSWHFVAFLGVFMYSTGYFVCAPLVFA